MQFMQMNKSSVNIKLILHYYDRNRHHLHIALDTMSIILTVSFRG